MLYVVDLLLCIRSMFNGIDVRTTVYGLSTMNLWIMEYGFCVQIFIEILFNVL